MLFKKIKKNKKGQQMIELVFALPILLICIGIVITSGQLIFAKMNTQMAVYQAGRIAITQGVNAGDATNKGLKATNKILKNAIGLDHSKTTFSIKGPWTPKANLEITVSTVVKTLFPIPGAGTLNPETTVNAKIVMQRE